MHPAFHLMAVATAALSLAACTTPTGAPNQPATGALIGGLTGAALGHAVGHTGTSTAIGGVVGAMVGGAIGTQIQQQQAELQSSLAGTGAQVVSNGSQINVILPENVTFATGSAVVNPGFYGALGSVAHSLNAHPQSRVQVVGHTDNVGTEAYNIDLSLRRALAVSQILVQDGLSNQRVAYYGKGESEPVASNQTSAGRAANRRVEIIIIPTQ